MIDTYQEAANRISELASKFEDCDEVCQHLKAASNHIANLSPKSTIVKITNVIEETIKTAAADLAATGE
jgi:hypothetical protein